MGRLLRITSLLLLASGTALAQIGLPFSMFHPNAAVASGTVINLMVSSTANDAGSQWGDEVTTDPANYVGLEAGNTAEAAFRWSLAVPQGATIDSAYVSFMAGGTNNLTTGDSIEFACYADDNVAVFADAHLHSMDAHATVGTTKVIRVAQSGVNVWQSYSGMASIVQEIVNRAGWVSGNYVGIILVPHSGWAMDHFESISDYSTNPTTAPILRVVYR